MSSHTETTPNSGTDVLHRVRRARARSGSSNLLRYGLLVAGVTLVFGFAWQLGLFEGDRTAKVALAPVKNPRLAIAVTPTFSGMDKSNRPYSIEADTGFLDEKTDDVVHMKNMRGAFERPSGATVNVTSAAAAYDKKTRKMVVAGNVVMSDGDRFSARMEAATLDTATHAMQSRSKVVVKMGTGTATADSMTVSEEGAKITLKGGVKARFMTKPEPPKGGTP